MGGEGAEGEAGQAEARAFHTFPLSPLPFRVYRSLTFGFALWFVSLSFLYMDAVRAQRDPTDNPMYIMLFSPIVILTTPIPL